MRSLGAALSCAAVACVIVVADRHAHHWLRLRPSLGHAHAAARPCEARMIACACPHRGLATCAANLKELVSAVLRNLDKKRKSYHVLNNFPRNQSVCASQFLKLVHFPEKETEEIFWILVEAGGAQQTPNTERASLAVQEKPHLNDSGSDSFETTPTDS